MMTPSDPPHPQSDSNLTVRSQDDIVLRPTQKAVSRVIDGQALILDAARDEIRQLNEVGSLIWSMILKSGSTRDDILRAVIDQFEVEPSQARIDLDAFLTELHDLALIEYISP